MTNRDADKRWSQAFNAPKTQQQPKRELDQYDLEAEQEGSAIRHARNGRTMTCRGKRTR